MQFITTDQRIAVEAFSVGSIYQIIFTNNSYFLGACVGIGDNFVMFQRPEPELLFALTMQSASDVAAINDDIVISRTYSGAPPLSFLSNGQPLLSWTMYGNTMQNGTPTPTEPVPVQGVGDIDDGQYKIPILSGNVTTPINLNTMKSTRRIKKLVLTGQEDDWRTSLPLFNHTFGLRANVNISYALCNTAIWNTTPAQTINAFDMVYSSGNAVIRFNGTGIATSVNSFKSYLQQQYAAGTPVTVWYILTESETGIVNEPLMRIDNYADSISDVATIPTARGTNTLTIGTTVQPSSITLTAQQ